VPGRRPLALDVDHTWASGIYADDRNTVRVGGLGGAGCSTCGCAGRGRGAGRRRGGGGRPAAPVRAVQNGARPALRGIVTVNGAGGRVLEPSPGRTVYAGLAVGG
jgi:hypothetical protein